MHHFSRFSAISKVSNLRLISALCCFVASGAVHASGFQLIEQNSSGLANAYAGSAVVADNASTIFYNPAGMTELKPFEISAGGTLIRPSFQFTDQGSSTGALTGNGGDAGGGWQFVPNSYISWAVSKDLYIGMGLSGPFGLKTEYDNPWIGAAQSRTFDIKTYNFNPSVAWRLNDEISLGFGVNYQKMETKFIRTAGTLASPLPLSTSTVTLDVDNWAWGWNAGILAKLSPQTKMGFSYRSATSHTLKGSLNVTGPSSTLNTGGSSAAQVKVKLPDTALFSISHQLDPQWELLGDISWTGWSSLDKLDIVRTSGNLNGQIAQSLDVKFKDTWRIAVGANYRLSPEWTLKMGTAYDKTPVSSPELRLTSLPDNNRVWLSGGAQWNLDQSSKIDFGVAYLYVKDTPIDNNQNHPSTNTYHGHVKGFYSNSIWLVGAQYSKSF